MLHAEGNNYHTLVKNAYKTREQYEAYLHQLAAAEQEVDQAIGEIHGEAGDIWERLRAEQVQVKELKEKEVNQIF
jgi:D-alanyl-D-alanine dipeptidase